MNRIFSTKLPSLVLLIVMLLNPIVGLASTLFIENMGLEKSVQEVQSMEMSDDMTESCHDHAVTNLTSSEDDSTQEHSECCDEPCMCAQGGCHSSVATFGSAASSFSSSSVHFYPRATSYISPILSFQTPPPII